MQKNMSIMSTNAKTLVWKHEYDVKCDVKESAHQVQMTSICHSMTPLPWKFSAFAPGLQVRVEIQDWDWRAYILMDCLFAPPGEW